jgi:hypothetical protein
MEERCLHPFPISLENLILPVIKQIEETIISKPQNTSFLDQANMCPSVTL